MTPTLPLFEDQHRSTRALPRIFIDGKFDELPEEVRHHGPWNGPKNGDVENLLPEYQCALAKSGYVISQSTGSYLFLSRHDGRITPPTNLSSQNPPARSASCWDRNSARV